MKLSIVLTSSVLIFLLLSVSVSAYDLADFPTPFIKEKQFDVIAVAAKNTSDVFALIDLFIQLEMESAIPLASGCGNDNDPKTVCADGQMVIREAKLPEQVTNLSQNIISIGGPCANNVTARIMNVSSTWPECANGFINGSGRVKIYNKWNGTQLVIAGYSAEDTKMAAAVMRDYVKLDIRGYELKITGDVKNPNVKIRITGDEPKDCEVDNECLKVCVAGCCPCGDWGVEAFNKSYIRTLRINPSGNCSGVMTTGGCRADVHVVAACINNKCEAILEENFNFKCPIRTHIDCMPGVLAENVKYCIPENRKWIQENCNVTYTD